MVYEHSPTSITKFSVVLQGVLNEPIFGDRFPIRPCTPGPRRWSRFPTRTSAASTMLRWGPRAESSPRALRCAVDAMRILRGPPVVLLFGGCP